MGGGGCQRDRKTIIKKDNMPKQNQQEHMDRKTGIQIGRQTEIHDDRKTEIQNWKKRQIDKRTEKK